MKNKRKNIFKEIYNELEECDGGCISGGDMSAANGTANTGNMITTGDVLGNDCDHEEKGYMSAGCFHIPKSVLPVLKRYEIPSKKKKGLKNPYAKGATIIGKLTESGDLKIDFPKLLKEADSTFYTGEAKKHFDKIIDLQLNPNTDVLYFNPIYKLAWMIRPNGQLDLFKPIDNNGLWTVIATRLTQDNNIEFLYKGGKYACEELALNAIYKATNEHKKLENILIERCKDEDIVIVCDIKQKRLHWLLNNSKHDVDNFCPDYIRKTLMSNPIAMGVFSCYDRNNALALMTVIPGYGPGTYLHEMTGFIKGGGKQLVKAAIEKYGAVWGLVALILADNGKGKCLGTNLDLLNKFYKKIPELKFYSVKNSVFDGAEATFMYAGISDSEFAEFCEDNFGLNSTLQVNEQKFSSRDIMNWEAHGRDPRYFPTNKQNINTHAIKSELKLKFYNQFEDIRLTNIGRTWRVEFFIDGLDHKLNGLRLVKTVIPRVDDIIRLLRIRGIETNQYDITAVPVIS